MDSMIELSCQTCLPKSLLCKSISAIINRTVKLLFKQRLSLIFDMEQTHLQSKQNLELLSNQREQRKIKSRAKSDVRMKNQRHQNKNQKNEFHLMEHMFSAKMAVKVEEALISQCQSHLHRQKNGIFDLKMIAQDEPQCTAGDFQGRKALKLIKKNFKKHRTKGKSALVQLTHNQSSQNSNGTLKTLFQRNSNIKIIIKNVQCEIYEQNRSSEATPQLASLNNKNKWLKNENIRRWSLNPQAESQNKSYQRSGRSRTNLDKFIALPLKNQTEECPGYPIPLEGPPSVEPQVVRIYRIREAGRIPQIIQTFVPKKKTQNHHSNDNKVIPNKLAYNYDGKLIQMEDQRKKPVTDPKYIQCEVKVNQEGKITDGKELVKSKHRNAINPYKSIQHSITANNSPLSSHKLHLHPLIAEQQQSPFLASLHIDKLKAPTSKQTQNNSQKSMDELHSNKFLDFAMDGKKVGWIKWQRLVKRKKGKSLNQTQKSFHIDKAKTEQQIKMLGSKQLSKQKPRTNSLNCMISMQNTFSNSLLNTMNNILVNENEANIINVQSSNHQISFNKNKVGLLFEESGNELLNSDNGHFPNKINKNKKSDQNQKHVKQKLFKKNIKSVKFDFDSHTMKKKTSPMNFN